MVKINAGESAKDDIEACPVSVVSTNLSCEYRLIVAALTTVLVCALTRSRGPGDIV